MPNYYFTYWIASHGKDAFKNLADKICQNIKIPTPIIKALGKDEFLIEYCIVVYNIVALNYFGLSTNQISFMLDLSLTPGTSKVFPPCEILEAQKEVIPEIEEYIRKDFNFYKK